MCYCNSTGRLLFTGQRATLWRWRRPCCDVTAQRRKLQADDDDDLEQTSFTGTARVNVKTSTYTQTVCL